MNRLKSQGLTLCLLAAAGAAFIVPELGAKGGPLKSEYTTKGCVALAFFLQGLSMRTRQILRGAINVRLHLFCQSWIFLLAPTLMYLALLIFGPWIHTDLHGGLLYLAVLPTTISSSIILTSSSNGDAGAALFNATFSNIVGVIITPIWCLAFFAQTSGEFPSLGSLVGKIALLVLMPLLIGQIIRPLTRHWIDNWKSAIKQTCNGMIVFVVYVAFCNSVKDEIWAQFDTSTIILVLVVSLLFLLLVSALTWTTTYIASPKIDQRIAAFFCGSQKSLAAGIPMASIIFSGQTGITQEGLIVLPIMLYHSMQLFLASILIPVFKSKVQSE